jgi:hypothetical protein
LILSHNNRLDKGTLPSRPIDKAHRIALHNAAMDDDEKRAIEDEEEEEELVLEKGSALSGSSNRRVKRRRLDLLNVDDAKVAHTVHVLEERLPGVSPMSRQDLAPSRLRAGLGGAFSILGGGGAGGGGGGSARRRVYLLPCFDGSEIYAVTSLKRRPVFVDPISGRSISFLDAMDLSVANNLDADARSECKPRTLIPVIIEHLLAQVKAASATTTLTSGQELRSSSAPGEEEMEEESVFFNHSVFTVIDSNALGGFAQIAATR